MPNFRMPNFNFCPDGSNCIVCDDYRANHPTTLTEDTLAAYNRVVNKPYDALAPSILANALALLANTVKSAGAIEVEVTENTKGYLVTVGKDMPDYYFYNGDLNKIFGVNNALDLLCKYATKQVANPLFGLQFTILKRELL